MGRSGNTELKPEQKIEALEKRVEHLELFVTRFIKAGFELEKELKTITKKDIYVLPEGTFLGVEIG